MAGRNGGIDVDRFDVERLKVLLEVSRRAVSGASERYLQLLLSEVRSARVFAPHELPNDVVAMGSRVRVTDLDSGKSLRFRLVMPSEADGLGRLSILCPLGMSVFGYRAGDRIEWGPADRLIRLRIDRVSKPVHRYDRVSSGKGRPDSGWRIRVGEGWPDGAAVRSTRVRPRRPGVSVRS